jgi:hypothetical protein
MAAVKTNFFRCPARRQWSIRRWTHEQCVLFLVLSIVVFLGGCSDGERSPPERQSPPRIPLVSELIAAPPAPGLLSTVGYLYIDAEGARLISGVSGAAGELQPIGAQVEHIWLDEIPPAVEAELNTTGETRYGAVRAAGTFSGPGSYGPAGRSLYQMVDVTYTTLVASAINIALLENNSAIYEQQLVRLNGFLLVGTSSALLVDHLGSGGVPGANARQLKVAYPIHDEALLQQLQGAPSAAARFGPVSIEGFWQGGVLYPLHLSAGS